MAVESPNRLLICLRYGIGDLVMELPALRGLRSRLPKAHLTALGAAPAVALLEGDPDFDAVIPAQRFGFQHWGHRGTAAARERLGEWLIAGAFDQVLDASHAVVGVREVISAAAIPVLNTESSFETNEEPLEGRGVRSIWRSAVQAWGLAETGSHPEPNLHISEAVCQSARHFCYQRGLGDRVAVGIAPIASTELKRWPLEQLGKVVRWLTGEQGRPILVFSAPGEEKVARELLAQAVLPGRAEFVPPFHLQQTAALIACCGAFLSNDTGLMHIAAAMDVPTVAVFGPTSQRVYLPAGTVAVSSGSECSHRVTDRFGPSPCLLQNRCLIGRESCISAVSVEQVTAALERVLCHSFEPQQSSQFSRGGA
ncbi:glycosyltransferase family 9 protein [Nitrosococcus wardiae]|nr:glycosyltransferase family 9 protein [Nitrosococcus wardiae]